MSAPIYEWLKASAPLRALIADGEGELAAYPDIAPERVKPPYVVWTLVSSLPENYLADAPDMDDERYQFTAWAADPQKARALADAVSEALQAHGHQVLGLSGGQDPETRRFSYIIDFEFWSDR